MKNFIKQTYNSLVSHDLFNLSANISFFAIIALLPLSMIFVSVMAYSIGSDVVITQMADVITEVVPGARDIFMSNVNNLLNSKSAVGWWGAGFLLLISTVLFGSLEHAFDKIFESEKKRNFFHSRLLSIGVISLILLLFFLPWAIRILELVITNFGYSIPLSLFFSGKFLFVIISILSFVVMIMIVPNQKVKFTYALLGGAMYTIGVAVAKYIYHWYLLMAFDKYNLIYGSLTALVLSVLWIYYLVLILLLSAELVACLQRRSVK